MFIALYMPKPHQTLTILPIWTLLVLSLLAMPHLHPIPMVSATYTMSTIIHILYCPVMLSAQKEPLKFERENWALRDAYKLYNNPRRLPQQTPKGPPLKKRKIIQYAVLRLLKAVGLCMVIGLLSLWFGRILSLCEVSDLAPERESLLRNLIRGETILFDIVLRWHVTIWWLVESILELELCHTLFSIIFVCILRLDKPDEWTDLFGKATDVYSLKDFWGKFWHQLLSPAAIEWARFFLRRIPFLKSHSWLAKPFVAFFVFSVSGLAHAFISWSQGEVAMERELYFFWASFAVVCFEVVISKLAALILKTSRMASIVKKYCGNRAMKIARQILGMIWVLGFFYFMVPCIAYPRIYRELQQLHS